MKLKPSAENLKQVLWETLTDLRTNKRDTKHANAVSQNARMLLGVVRTELQISQFIKTAGRMNTKNLLEFTEK